METVTSRAPVFRLFACCLPVRGALRSVVCDLQRHRYHLIPNGLYEILTTHRDRTLDELKEIYGSESYGLLDDYFEFLVREDLGFWTTEPEAFPDLEGGFQTPETITNAIVDADSGSRHDWADVFSQLNDLGCKALELRFYDALGLEELNRILALASDGSLRSIDLLVRWTPEVTLEALQELVGRHRRIRNVTVHSAPENRDHPDAVDSVSILFVTQKVTSHAACGQVLPAYFTIGTESVLEAMQFNSCLHRKISVDARGEIRNCPSFPAGYGNARDTRLQSVVERPEFREVWGTTKDQVETCKDCEFRYICPDCRAWVRDAGDRFSKPSKCRYDPYTATWAEPGGETVGEAG